MSDTEQKTTTIRDVYFRELNPTLHQHKDGDTTTVDFTLSDNVIETWTWTERELVASDDPFGQVKRETDLIARVVAFIGDMPAQDQRLDRLRADLREYITFLEQYPEEPYPQLTAAEVIAQLEAILDLDSPGGDGAS